MGSVLPRPLEILPSLAQCSLSRVALHLFQAWGKPERQGGIALWFWCSVSGTGCQGLHSLKAQEAHRELFPTSSQDSRGLAGITGTCPQPADVPLLSTQTSQNSSLLHENHPSSHSRQPQQGDLRSDRAKPLPYLTNRSADFCRISLWKYWHKNKRDPSDFQVFHRESWGSHAAYWELPDVSRLLPHCNKASYPGVAFPALEGPALKGAGRFTLTAFVCKLRETQWSFTQWNRPPGYGEPTRAKVVNLLIIPRWHSQEHTWKGRKAHAKHRQWIAGWDIKISLESRALHPGHR